MERTARRGSVSRRNTCFNGSCCRIKRFNRQGLVRPGFFPVTMCPNIVRFLPVSHTGRDIRTYSKGRTLRICHPHALYQSLRIRPVFKPIDNHVTGVYNALDGNGFIVGPAGDRHCFAIKQQFRRLIIGIIQAGPNIENNE